MTTTPSEFTSPIEPERWDALARYVAGESSGEEAQAMRDWLAGDPARAELVAALEQMLQRVAFQPPKDLDVEAALQQVSARLNEPEIVAFPAANPRVLERRFEPWRRMGLRAAAAIVVVLGLTLVWRASHDGDSPALAAAQTFQTTTGQTDTLSLADGSQVVLGPASRLTVPVGYAQSRQVELSGQALFDVRHDASKPFTVRAGIALIQDLGTVFSVRSNPNDEVRVAVTAGSVRLQAVSGADRGVVLRAGDRGVLDHSGRALAEPATATEADVAWTRGRLVYDDAPLAQVMDDLRRWYGIELRVADATLAGRHLVATFEGESSQQVLEIIARALGARIEMRGDTAIMRAQSESPRR